MTENGCLRTRPISESESMDDPMLRPRILPIDVGGLELAHVEADHPLHRAEQEFGDCLGELGLAGAGRAGEQKHPDRLVGIVQPGLEHGDAVDHRLDRLVLTDHARGEEIADRL